MLTDRKPLFIEAAGVTDVINASKHGQLAMRDLIGLRSLISPTTMARSRSTSKKRSAASSSRRKPPEPLVFFIDRSLGRKKVPDALRAAGVEIRRATKPHH
jgi:hypothetical protein